MGYDDDSFSFANEKKRKKRKKIEENNSIIEFEDGESVDDTYYGYNIEDVSAVKPKNIRRNVFIITSAVVLLLAAVILVFIFVFRVRNVTVENNVVVSSEKIIEDAGIRIGAHIYSISKSDIESNVTEKNPYIKSVRVKRRFPGTLRLIVEENTAAAYYETNGKYAILASDMSVLYISDKVPEGLLNIILTGEIISEAGKSPEFSDGYGKLYMSVIQAVCDSERLKDVYSVDMSDRFDIKLNCMGRYTVYIGNRTDIADKLALVFRTIDYLETEYGSGGISGELFVSSDPANRTVSFVPG